MNSTINRTLNYLTILYIYSVTCEQIKLRVHWFRYRRHLDHFQRTVFALVKKY